MGAKAEAFVIKLLYDLQEGGSDEGFLRHVFMDSFSGYVWLCLAMLRWPAAKPVAFGESHA